MAQSDTTKPVRYELLDVLRGSAILMMFSFHFSYDLNNFHYIQTDFYHNPFWLNYRTLIVSTFLSVMGMSLYVAHHRGLQKQKYFRRLTWLVLCALLISVATHFWAGSRFIYFGILHFIAVASVLALPFVRLYWSNLLLGVGIIIIGNQLSLAFMNPRYLNWIGLMQGKPLTDDYVPLFPWFGVVLLGIFFARWALVEGNFPDFGRWRSGLAGFRLLRFGGRHSLLIYMLHQPIFIGCLYLLRMLTTA